MRDQEGWAAWRPAAMAARATIRHGVTRAVFDHWIALGDRSRPPARRDLDPTAMAPALPRIWLLECLPAEDRLRYRLMGDEVAQRYDIPMAGRYLDEGLDLDKNLEATARERILSYFLACVERPAVMLLSGQLYHERQKPGYGERLLLPLFDHQGGAEGILGVTYQEGLYGSREEARVQATRVLSCFPLDGAAPTEPQN